MTAILVVLSAQNMEMLYIISYTSFIQSNNSLCLIVSVKKIFKISANQNQELPIATMFLVQSG